MIDMTNKIKRAMTDFDYKEFFTSILWAILIAVVFRTFLFEPFKIPSGSMIPTLQVGDYLFVSKYKYGYSRYSFPFGFAPLSGRVFSKTPDRGDIIVFKGVKDPQTFYIKRLIGLPGDVVQVKQGLLYINNVAVRRELTGEFMRRGLLGENKRYDEYKETLPNGVEHATLDANVNHHISFPDNTQPYMVPEANYFFMGDNRNNSIDSRFLDDMGFIPEDRLLGKAELLFMTDDFSIVDFFTDLKTGRALSLIK